MKYEQIDVALSFLDITDRPRIILQHEHTDDKSLIINYLKSKFDRYKDGIKIRGNDVYIYSMFILTVVNVGVAMRMTDGYNNIPTFFIERESDNYEEGDSLKRYQTTSAGIVTKEEFGIGYVPTTTGRLEIRHAGATYGTVETKEKLPRITSTVSAVPIRHSDIRPYTIVKMPLVSDTLVIQYPKASMLQSIRRCIARHRRPSSRSFINNWIDIDIFTNPTGQYPKDTIDNGEMPWVRIMYECMENNPCVGTRYVLDDVFMIKINDKFDGTNLEINTINEGRKSDGIR